MEQEIMVSVICNAYNHEKYIKDALEGFVMQQTDFPFEVLIHDDASTDGTAAIIRAYEEKYPHLIKPIYDKVNLHSRHDGSLGRAQYGRAKGKYLAICEGDDYWTDPLKLQKQYDALEQHPEVDICGHCMDVMQKGKPAWKLEPSQVACIIPLEQTIRHTAGVGTASLMYRRSLRDNSYAFFRMQKNDFATQILGSLRGGMLYLPDNMAVYRLLTESSVTAYRMKHRNALRAAHNKEIRMLRALNRDTAGKYSRDIRSRIRYNHFSNLLSYVCNPGGILNKVKAGLNRLSPAAADKATLLLRRLR